MYYAKRSISLLLLLLRCQGPALWDPMDWKYHRAPCPSSSLGVFPSSSTLSQWCHPTISSSVVPFSSCLQSFPASWSFPMSWLFASGGQSIGTSSSESVLPMHIQSWFPLGLIWSPCSPRDFQESSPTPQCESIKHSCDKPWSTEKGMATHFSILVENPMNNSWGDREYLCNIYLFNKQVLAIWYVLGPMQGKEFKIINISVLYLVGEK